MIKSIVRATFGRLSEYALERITIGHIQIEGTVLDTRRYFDTSGSATKKKKQGVRFVPYQKILRKQLLKEDEEIVEIVTAMVKGGLI